MCEVVGVDDLIIRSKFGFSISKGFRSTRGQNFHFPIDFAGRRYNCAVYAQPAVFKLKSAYVVTGVIADIKMGIQFLWTTQ